MVKMVYEVNKKKSEHFAWSNKEQFIILDLHIKGQTMFCNMLSNINAC